MISPDKIIPIKAYIKQNLISKLESSLSELHQSAKEAHLGATHEDAKAKSKYDTHGLELSYLAGSLYQRAEHLKHSINLLKNLKVDSKYQQEVKIGSIAHVSNGSYYFISPIGAGEKEEYENLTFTIITPDSPLGQKLIGLYPEEELEQADWVLIESY